MRGHQISVRLVNEYEYRYFFGNLRKFHMVVSNFKVMSALLTPTHSPCTHRPETVRSMYRG